ncbi:MAG: hypothetical protein GYA36_02035 [Veillonellaceae bacterium]|nr:hypothetical protein [Veillonellaceae bacterium]
MSRDKQERFGESDGDPPMMDYQEERERLLDRLDLAREENNALRELLVKRHGWDPQELSITVEARVTEKLQQDIDRLTQWRTQWLARPAELNQEQNERRE